MCDDKWGHYYMGKETLPRTVPVFVSRLAARRDQNLGIILSTAEFLEASYDTENCRAMILSRDPTVKFCQYSQLYGTPL
jgi:hypothetical protein